MSSGAGVGAIAGRGVGAGGAGSGGTWVNSFEPKVELSGLVEIAV